MKPMSEGLAFTLVAVGLGFNVIGLVLGARAFAVTWREFGREPLWPWLSRAVSSGAALLARLNPWRKRSATILSVDGAVHAHASASARVLGRVGFPAGATESELIHKLVAAVEGIYGELSEERELTRQALDELHIHMGELTSHVTSETSRLEEMSRRIATGDVRVQLAGLVAIGIGTVLSAIPVVWGLLVEIAT